MTDVRNIVLVHGGAMAERAGATTSEAPGSHAIYVSRPAVVGEVIVQAARNALQTAT